MRTLSTLVLSAILLCAPALSWASMSCVPRCQGSVRCLPRTGGRPHSKCPCCRRFRGETTATIARATSTGHVEFVVAAGILQASDSTGMARAVNPAPAEIHRSPNLNGASSRSPPRPA